ncbi:hypothetical protein [Streptomyces griseus]|uniref:hypothetical protein n=1 Tax=Streptomyces griseus TaxID=1911 RepID=UPI00055DC7FB|nr:hypothetical protein [Streptomyces griseus]
MTQSGQGEEPSARPAREGIVLPSDGGEPLLPGMTGGPGDRQQGPQPGHATGQQSYGGQYGRQDPAAAPPGGQAWDHPWGPGQHQDPAPSPGQGWPAPADQQWGTPEPPAWGTPQQSGALPPESTPSQGHEGHQGRQGYGGYEGHQGYGADAQQQGGYGPGAQQQGGYGADDRQQGYGTGLQPQGYGTGAQSPAYGTSGAPLPPADEGATQYIPPVPAAQGDEGATQYIPPVPAAPADEGATQYIPPVPAASADEGATQYLPPVGPGALPPETPAESTHFLGRSPQGAPSTGRPGPGAGPLPPTSGSDAEATQYIPPVTGQPGGAPYGNQRTPSEFDNLFRSDQGGGAQAGSTQQLPLIQQPQGGYDGYAPAASYAPPTGPGGGRGAAHGDDGDGGRGRRTGSRVPLIAAIGVGIAVVGIGAGALLAGGGGGDDKGDNKTAAASAPATDASGSAAADPAKQQATALDALLADSGSSRTSVINAVAAVKACNNLDQAATDLRDAAKQRNDLVTKLSGLSVDQLPDHTELTNALTKAWQASAAADDHYAAWADQVAGNKKMCKKGQARVTGQTQAGNRESGTASIQKKTAARLWNAIAEKYGLTQRQPTQL